MKKLIIWCLLIPAAFALKAQTAVDFTLTDCDGNSQQLYSLLDSGKTVVLIYEHQCSSCSIGARRITTVINTWYSGDTNIIVMYLDNGGNACASTASWVSSKSFVPGPMFEYSSNYSSPYGSGMPVIVITSGSNHAIYLTALGYAAADTASVHDALESALNSGTGIENASNESFCQILSYSNGNLIITSDVASTDRRLLLSVYNSTGQLVTENFLIQETTNIDLSGLAKGIYILSVREGINVLTKKIVIE